MKRQSTEMREDNWSALSAVASSLGCASWRVLLRRIAVGELVVVNPAIGRPIVRGGGEPNYVRDADAQSHAEKCSRCKTNDAEPDHSCPFQREINDNMDENYCNCCASCRSECSDNI